MPLQPTTRGAVLGVLARKVLPEGDPDRLYVEWLEANAGRLREAIKELGVDVEEGSGFAFRLEEAVKPLLGRK